MFAIILVLIVFCLLWWHRAKEKEELTETMAKLQNDRWGEDELEAEKEITDQKNADQ